MRKESFEESANPANSELTQSVWSTYFELGKIRLSMLVTTTTAAGFILASNTHFDPTLFILTVCGTACAALGANAFNEWWETEPDSRMERTCHRPLPSRRLSRRQALVWAYGIAVFGILLLWIGVNSLTAILALSNICLYVLLYTPLKPYSAYCTLVGAICGSIPPLMGWTAAVGRLEYGAWVLSATLFIWQIPHFLSLGQMYREDYQRGGFRILPVIDSRDEITRRVVFLYSLALIPVGTGYYLAGMTGLIFVLVSILLGIGLFIPVLRFYSSPSHSNARSLFLATLLYLTLMLVFMIMDRTG